MASNVDARLHNANVDPKFLGDALLQAIGNTDICVFVYYPDQKRIEVPKNTCDKYNCKPEYENMPASFADDFVHDDDRAAFFELYRKINSGEKTASARFHSKDMSACCKVTLTEIGVFGAPCAEGADAYETDTANCGAKPVAAQEDSFDPRICMYGREVVGVIEDVSEWDRDKQLIGAIQARLDQMVSPSDDFLEARGAISETIGSQYYGIVYLWLESNTFLCYQSQSSDVISAIGEQGDYKKAWSAYIDTFVDASDHELVRKSFDVDALGALLKEQRTISFEYRRKGVGWTRGQIIAAKHDEAGNVVNAIFTVSDINSEITTEMARKQAVYESQHDKLTGAFNRTAFDNRMSSSSFDGRSVGFAIMDIDMFKEINDEYGHEVGDSVIADVANAISSSFRDVDELYRIGGDEFVVILSDADQSSWRAICRKLARIHSDFIDTSSNNIEITLSAGVCFSDSGLQEWMYRAADEALFYVKRNGRAGFALADASGKILDSWKDVDASENTIAALSGSSAAIARIEKSLDDTTPSRLFGGEAIRNVYGFPDDATPEECYEIWSSGIIDSYRGVLDEAVAKMMKSDNVECAFKWTNGKSEPFLVRLVGTAHTEGPTVVIYSIHRSLEGAIIVESDDSQRIIEAQSATYVSCVYVDLANNSYRMLKGTEELKRNLVPEDNAVEGTRAFVSRLVHPDYREKMAAFSELSTVSERLGTQASIDSEYLSLTGRGWCRATWFPVKRDADGVVTHVLFTVSTIDKAKQLEIQRELETARLMTLHYDAAETLLNTKIIAIALLEKSRCEGSMWTSFTNFSRAEDARMIELVHRDARRVPEAKRAEFIAKLDPVNIVDRVEALGKYSVTAETVLDDGSIRYVEYHFAEYDKDKRILLAVVEDVTAIHEESGRSVDDLFENVPGGLMTFEWDGADFKILHVSNYCEKIFGLKSSIRVGNPVLAFFDNVHPEDTEALRAAIHGANMASRELHHECRVWNADFERYVWVKVDSFAKEHDSGRYYVYAMFSDISKQIEIDEKLRRAIRYDALTGMYKRESFFESCRSLLDGFLQSQFYMAVLNVRRFRLYNASFGEDAGDELLKAISNGIRKMCADYEHVAFGRIEADVFGVFFSAESEEVAANHIGLVEKFFSEYNDEFLLEPAIGIYEVSDRKMTIASMLARATVAARASVDMAGFVCVYGDEMERQFDEEMLVANDMKLAISGRQFGVYLQPKYDLQTGELVGSEALVRWIHPNRGVMPPGKFIKVFEGNGSISKLDRYMLEAVCEVLGEWTKSGRDVKPISVNISRVSALNKKTVPYLKELVERYGIDPSLLEIELTESAYIEDPREIKRTLSELQSLGFKILMDDFGSGYSSLNTLRELPVDVLKLDMGFLSDSCNDPRGRAVLSATMAMTKDLDLPVIAEGVETKEQADYLRSLGCEYAQGYLYAKPMPVVDFESMWDEPAK